MDKRVTLKIDLTPAQREQIRQAIATETSALTLEAEALEDRVAPLTAGGLAGTFTLSIHPKQPCGYTLIELL